MEANGRPGAYTAQEGVMQRANMVDAEYFRAIARYLEEEGWITDAEPEYGVFSYYLRHRRGARVTSQPFLQRFPWVRGSRLLWQGGGGDAFTLLASLAFPPPPIGASI